MSRCPQIVCYFRHQKCPSHFVFVNVIAVVAFVTFLFLFYKLLLFLQVKYNDRFVVTNIFCCSGSCLPTGGLLNAFPLILQKVKTETEA